MDCSYHTIYYYYYYTDLLWLPCETGSLWDWNIPDGFLHMIHFYLCVSVPFHVHLSSALIAINGTYEKPPPLLPPPPPPPTTSLTCEIQPAPTDPGRLPHSDAVDARPGVDEHLDHLQVVALYGVRQQRLAVPVLDRWEERKRKRQSRGGVTWWNPIINLHGKVTSYSHMVESHGRFTW